MNRNTHLFGALTLICLVLVNSASAQYTLTTLVSFDGTNGGAAVGSLITDASGNLYGVTENGGANGCGTVFKLAAGTHALSTLATFSGTNGNQALSGLAADASGNLYGTTSLGGNGLGTVFKVAPGTNTLSTMIVFNATNGSNPSCDLLVDASGNLFGTTQVGGANNGGTVFEVFAATHTLSTLVAFNGTNGGSPWGGLIADAAGNLYGTTRYGGANLYYGTVFKVAAGTHALSTLATFNGTNGANPIADLFADANGNLYGTTQNGGNLTLNDGNGFGTVFKVAAGTNALTTLVAFNGTNGSFPEAGLIADANGNLYGTTIQGGVNGQGTVFEVAAGTNVLSTLATFDGTNGAAPECRLLADASGNLFGTTLHGGTGTVFELSPAPEPSTLALAACGLTALVLAKRRPARKSPPMPSRRSLLNFSDESL